MPHFLSIEALRALVDAPPDGDNAATGADLRVALGDTESEHLPFLTHLLGLPLSDGESMLVRFLDGPALTARYTAACRALLVDLSGSYAGCAGFRRSALGRSLVGRTLDASVAVGGDRTSALCAGSAGSSATTAGWKLIDQAQGVARRRCAGIASVAVDQFGQSATGQQPVEHRRIAAGGAQSYPGQGRGQSLLCGGGDPHA